MKTTLKIFNWLLLVCVLTTTVSCNSCKDEPPRARILNNGNVDVSVQIKTSGGNTENINNIKPGTSSDFKSYAAGEVTFTITPKDKSEIIEKVNVENCMDYEIAVNQENKITVNHKERG